MALVQVEAGLNQGEVFQVVTNLTVSPKTGSGVPAIDVNKK
jgi:hypothetical protein